MRHRQCGPSNSPDPTQSAAPPLLSGRTKPGRQNGRPRDPALHRTMPARRSSRSASRNSCASGPRRPSIIRTSSSTCGDEDEIVCRYCSTLFRYRADLGAHRNATRPGTSTATGLPPDVAVARATGTILIAGAGDRRTDRRAEPGCGGLPRRHLRARGGAERSRRRHPALAECRPGSRRPRTRRGDRREGHRAARDRGQKRRQRQADHRDPRRQVPGPLQPALPGDPPRRSPGDPCPGGEAERSHPAAAGDDDRRAHARRAAAISSG